MSSLHTFVAKAKVIRGVRFVFVGLFNTGFSYLIYAAFLLLGIGYQLANFLSLIIGILFSFKMQGSLVFANTDNRRLGRFVVTWVLIYTFNIAIISWFITLGFDAYSAGALSLPFSVALAYPIQKNFVFRQSYIEK